MRHTTRMYVAWACVLSALLAGVAAQAEDAVLKESASGKNRRAFQFHYTAFVKEIPKDSKKVELWLPVPQSDAMQSIENLRFIAPFPPEVNVEPNAGNKIAYWKLEDKAVGTFAVTMVFEAKRKETSGRLEKAGALTKEEEQALAPYLKPNRLVPVGEEVKELTAKAVGEVKSPLEVSKAAYEYVFENMRYDKPPGKGWGQGSTKWACDEKYGNCTDFHALFMSIGRSKGIPVKFEMGFSIPKGAWGIVAGYHCWAKFYQPAAGWVPVDISDAWRNKEKEYYYGHLTADRVHFSTGRDLDLVPKQAGEPLNFFIYPYAEADGKAFPVERAFSYQQL